MMSLSDNFEMMDVNFWLRDDVQHIVNFVGDHGGSICIGCERRG